MAETINLLKLEAVQEIADDLAALTAADRTATDADRVQTAADRVATGEDVLATEAASALAETYAGVDHRRSTWSQLAAVSGLTGEVGYVGADDAGTHTDPVASGTVPNSGVYVWEADGLGSAQAKRTGSTGLAGVQPALDATVANAKSARRVISGSFYHVASAGLVNRVLYLNAGAFYKESNGGSVEGRIAPIEAPNLSQNQAYIIDLDAPVLDGNGHLIPQKVTLASGAVAGWQTKNKYVLIGVDQFGNIFGEYKPNQTIGNNDGAAAFLKNDGDPLPTWNQATLTLTWPDLILIADWGSATRISLEAGSIVVPSADQFHTVVLDRRDLEFNTPASAVKVGDYLGSNGTDAIVASSDVYIPLFGVGRSGLSFSMRFPPTVGATNGPAVITAGTYEASEMVIAASADEVGIYSKGGKTDSSKYIKKTFGHGVNAGYGADVWRWMQASEAQRTGDTTFVSGIDLTSGGMQEMAIRFNGKPGTQPGVSDWIGGDVHGDETKFFARMLVDGVEKTLGSAANYRAKRVEFMQGSNVWEPSTDQSILAAKSYKYWAFEGDTVELRQRLVWEREYDLAQTYLTMLSWYRTVGSDVVSDKGYRSPLYETEDIAASGFPMVFTDADRAKASGVSGYSADIEVLEGWNKAGRFFNFSNSAAYNKFYFNFAPNGYLTTAGEVFDVKSRYRIGLKN